MPKTLADMTAEEREECVGMWASHKRHDGNEDLCENLGIISEVEERYAWLTYPKEGMEPYVFFFEDVTPRFDLPRACTPDGEPVQMTTERGLFYTLRDGGEEISLVADETDRDEKEMQATLDYMLQSMKRGTINKITTKTRYVTAWETQREITPTNGMVNPYVHP